MSWSEVIRLVKENSSEAFKVHVFAQLDDLVEEMRDIQEGGEQVMQDEGADAMNALDGPDMITNEEIGNCPADCTGLMGSIRVPVYVRLCCPSIVQGDHRLMFYIRYKDCKTSDSTPDGKTHKC